MAIKLFAVTLILSFVDLGLGKDPQVVLQCFHITCKHDEACRVYKRNGQVLGECIKPHTDHHIVPHVGCPPDLQEGHECWCTTTECTQNVHTGTTTAAQVAGGARGALHCNGHDCHHGQVCKFDLHDDGTLHTGCHNPDHKAVLCTQAPAPHHPCYCDTNDCTTKIYNLIYQNNHVQQTQQPLMCGGHICNPDHHHGEKCIITEKNGHELHLECKAPHHETHCLPNLLTAGDKCFCDTKSCVDQTLISLFAGHQVSGLICADHDDHVCHANEVCFINHDAHGHFKKHCGVKPPNGHECQSVPAVGQHCYCTTQECVYGKFTTTTAAPPTTTVQTAAPQTTDAETTIDQSNSSATDSITTENPTVVPTTGIQTSAPSNETTTDDQTTEQTNPPTSAMPVVTGNNGPTSDAQTNAPVTQAQTNPTTTATPDTNLTMTTMAPCTDNEDDHFSCVIYDMQYGLCSAKTGTLFDIANKRCRKYCGLCVDGSTVAPASTATASTTQVACTDNDNRCALFASQICSSTVSHDYMVATCAKTCNKCSEYLASLQAPQTKTKCLVCGDTNSMIPCTLNDIYDNVKPLQDCPVGYDFCMTDLQVDANNNKDVFKRCVKKDVCDTKWIKESADQDYCTKLGVVSNPNAHECHYCCRGDGCNKNIKPDDSLLVPSP